MKHSSRQADTKKNENRAGHFQDKKFSFRAYLPFYALLFIVFLMESLFLTIHREINLDEGWYLYASKLVYEGKMLYKDFAYTQGPVFPYVYGIFQQIFGTSRALHSLSRHIYSLKHCLAPFPAMFCFA